MNFQDRLSINRAEIIKSIELYTQNVSGSHNFKEILEYTLLDSGKLIRPIIVSAFGEAFGIDHAKLREFKIALEMLHVSSLIHDDLPGLDNDDFRRGKASAHIQFGEGKAILAGDLMISKALELITMSEILTELEIAKLLRILIRANVDLCEGQILDLNIRYANKSGSKFWTKDSKIRGMQY